MPAYWRGERNLKGPVESIRGDFERVTSDFNRGVFIVVDETDIDFDFDLD